MTTPATPDFDHAHRVERVTNISPASDAFVLFTLFTLFFTLACFALWMWFIWRKGQRRRTEEQLEAARNQFTAEPVAHLSDDASTEDEPPRAPWEKPADWWRK